jgi:hypothetical protein
MSLIFLVSSGTHKCFVCDSGTQEKKVEKRWHTGLVRIWTWNQIPVKCNVVSCSHHDAVLHYTKNYYIKVVYF